MFDSSVFNSHSSKQQHSSRRFKWICLFSWYRIPPKDAQKLRTRETQGTNHGFPILVAHFSTSFFWKIPPSTVGARCLGQARLERAKDLQQREEQVPREWMEGVWK